MDAVKLQELETAANIIMNPQMVSNEMRGMSESLIMDFRRTKNPFVLCRHILETSKNDFLQFEAAGLIKSALILEWNVLNDNDTLALQQYLMNYIMTHEGTIQQFVQERILQVVAIITKRRSITIEMTELLKVLSDLESIFETGDLKQQYIACRIVETLMQEFQITIKSDDTGLTFDDHFKAKKSFEGTALMKIFVTVMEPVRKLGDVFDAANSQIVCLLSQYLRILETILSWGCTSPLLSKRLISLLEAASKFEQSPSLRLGIKWEGVILDPNVIKLLFEIYWKVRDIPDLQRQTATCLVQLSTVYGSIMNKKENKLKFFVNYFNNFLQLITTVLPNIKREEALPFSQIVRTLIPYSRYPGMTMVFEFLKTILPSMYTMTSNFAEGAIHDEITQVDESVYMEALTNMLEAWLITHIDFPKEVVHPYLKEIFNDYLKCHLSPPHGIYAVAQSDQDEITEEEQRDRDKYKEQLTIIGAFGREFPAYSLPLLAKLLEERIQRLRGQLLRIHSSDSAALPDSDTKILDALYEDIHWLLLIVGHVLCKDFEGEEPMIVSDILAHSIGQAATADFDMATSLKLLASPSQCVSEFPNAAHNTDHVVRLIAAVFRLCEIEKNAVEANMTVYLSPEVTSTIMWLLKFWSDAYLLFQSSYYSKIPDTLKESFGMETAGGVWTSNFILSKIYLNVKSFPGEEFIVDDSISLLKSLVKKKHKCPVVFGADNFKLILELRNAELPLRTKCGLLEALVTASSCISDPKLAANYLDNVTRPICAKYKQVAASMESGSERNKKCPIMIEQLVHILTEIQACSRGCRNPSTQHVYESFEFILVQLPELLNYLSDFSQIVEISLELLSELVQMTSFLQQRHTSQKVFEICYNCIKVYAKRSQSRVNLEATGEEDRVQDLLLLLKLMNHLLSKCYLDFVDDEENQNMIGTAEVVVFGLQNILPLITSDLLLYPNFCLQFYQTITFFFETKSHTICTLQPDFLQYIFQSIQLGLTNFSPEVQSLCLDFLQIMANTVYTDQNPESFMYNALGPFLKVLLEIILGQQLVTENKVECSKALFGLICVYKEQYVPIMKEVISVQRRSSTDIERLEKEFIDLTNNVNFTNQRAGQFKFIDKFEKFWVNIGFLFTI